MEKKEEIIKKLKKYDATNKILGNIIKLCNKISNTGKKIIFKFR